MPRPARRTSEEVVLALTDAGFFRIFTPIRFGGYVADIRTAIATRLWRPRPLQGDGWIRSPAGAGGDPTLLNVHGAGSFAEKDRMQQYRRDANTAARHPGLNAVVGREVDGKSLQAVEGRISPVV
jgi:alkylation response protein AidB-like acyl-CoA dehydrogenase